jgi:hypothetical protein
LNFQVDVLTNQTLALVFRALICEEVFHVIAFVGIALKNNDTGVGDCAKLLFVDNEQ